MSINFNSEITDATKVKTWIEYINDLIKNFNIRENYYFYTTVNDNDDYDSSTGIYTIKGKLPYDYSSYLVKPKAIVTYAGVVLDPMDYSIEYYFNNDNTDNPSGIKFQFTNGNPPESENGYPIRIMYIQNNSSNLSEESYEE